MSSNLRRILAMSVLVTPLAVAGCASQTEIDELRSELTRTQSAADAAAAEAREARAEAAEAKARADAASQAVTDVSRRADRMYDRSLRK